MKKDIIFFHPRILDDGCKKTLEVYTDHLVDKFNVHLVTNTTDEKLLKNLNSKVKIINFKKEFIIKNFFLNEIYCAYKLFQNNFKKSLIISLDGYFILLLLKFFRFNFKLIVRVANPILTDKKNGKYLTTNPGLEIGKIDLIFLKYADLTILYAPKFKSFLAKNYNIKNTVIIRNYFKKYKINKTNQKKKYCNIFFIGRLVNIKDPVFFLKNCIEISYYENIKIHIVGKGPEYENLKLLAKKRFKIVKFHGFVKSPFKKFNKKIDIFCLTSRYDGTPNVLGEAISMKIPSIAPKNIGCANELLGNGDFGSLYKQNNSKDFKKKLTNIINNYNGAKRKAKKAYNALEKYNLENTLQKLENKILSFF